MSDGHRLEKTDRMAAIASRILTTAREHPGVVSAIAIALVVFAASAPMFFGNAPFITESIPLQMGMARGHQLFSIEPMSPFVDGTGLGGVFNPLFAFYGGPLFSVLGFLNRIPLVGPSGAVALLTAAGFLSAYVGSYWFSRELGLRRGLAHVPALVVLTSAYWSTDVYARGDLAEYIGISSIPLVVAAATDLLRNDQVRRSSLLALFIGLIFFTGSHNITLLWGTVLGVVIVALFAIAFWRKWQIPFSRFGACVLVALVATAANSWALIPNILYGTSTALARASNIVPLSFTGMFDAPSVIFDPLRVVPVGSTTKYLYVQIPDWYLLWAFAAGLPLIATYRQHRRGLLRGFACCALMLAVLLALIVSGGALTLPPPRLSYIQFPYRLSSYVVLAVAGLVIVSLLALQGHLDVRSDRARGRATALVGLVAVALVSTGLFAWQLYPNFFTASSPQPPTSAQTAEASVAGFYGNNFTDWQLPVVAVPAGRTLNFTIDDVEQDEQVIDKMVALPPGTAPIATNIVGGPQLVAVGGGVTEIGRTSNGYVVIRRVKADRGAVRVVVEAANRAPVVATRYLSAIVWSAVGAAIIVAALSWLAEWVRRERNPSRRTSMPAAENGRR